MKLFQVVPEIHKYKDIKDMNEVFNIGKKDLILTHEFIYNEFIKPLNVDARFLFQEMYGVGEPTEEMVNQIIADTSDIDFDRVIAIGGGTVVDIAKILALKTTKDVLDLFERKVPIEKAKKLIIMPTTCGTGSEVTNISIMGITSKKTKMGLAENVLCADYAVFIPDLVKGLPFKFFVYSSVDALIHAVEAYVSPKANVYTDVFCIKAVEMIMNGYKQILEKGQEYRLEIIEEFLIGSNFAGIGFANAGVGAVHALSYPLGGKYHVPHGEANYQFFTEVFKTYNKLNPHGKIKKMNNILANLLGLDSTEKVYEELDVFLSGLLPKQKLREYGMTEEEVSGFSDLVLESQQRLLSNNYIPLTRDKIFEIYEALY